MTQSFKGWRKIILQISDYKYTICEFMTYENSKPAKRSEASTDQGVTSAHLLWQNAAPWL